MHTTWFEHVPPDRYFIVPADGDNKVYYPFDLNESQSFLAWSSKNISGDIFVNRIHQNSCRKLNSGTNDLCAAL